MAVMVEGVLLLLTGGVVFSSFLGNLNLALFSIPLEKDTNLKIHFVSIILHHRLYVSFLRT